MTRKYLTAVLGLTSVITLSTITAAQAEPEVYLEVGGRESLNLDSTTLSVLESIGLTFTGANSTATPAPGFSIGAALLPPSFDPEVRGTTFTFLYEDDPLLYVPLGGTEEFSGTFSFDVDPTQLSGLGTELTIGNFSNAFDETFSFFLTDTLTTGLRVLDVTSPGIPDVDLETQTWMLEGLEFFISQEFSDFLVDAGATQSVVGLKFADAKGDRSFVLASSVSTPEPTTTVALLFSGICAITFKKRQKNLK